MKKHFIKISAPAIIIAIFFMAGGLCFNSLLALEAGAHVPQMTISDLSLKSGLNVCGNNQIAQPIKAADESFPLVIASPHGIGDSCCTSDGHQSILTATKSLEINKFIPSGILMESFLPVINQKSAVYLTPIIPPPELSLLKSTILRI
jgi:hypothetical protein